MVNFRSELEDLMEERALMLDKDKSSAAAIIGSLQLERLFSWHLLMMAAVLDVKLKKGPLDKCLAFLVLQLRIVSMDIMESVYILM